jgi:hypothetical protein
MFLNVKVHCLFEHMRHKVHVCVEIRANIYLHVCIFFRGILYKTELYWRLALVAHVYVKVFFFGRGGGGEGTYSWAYSSTYIAVLEDQHMSIIALICWRVAPCAIT